MKFDLSLEAAAQNMKVFQSHQNSLENIIQSTKNTLNYGSEFKPVRILQYLFRTHVHWKHFRRLLTQGSNFPLSEINEDCRRKDFDHALQYGNHKSATMQPDVLLAHMKKESQQGWIIPLLPEHARLLPKATISPMGIVSQSKINNQGEIISSNRITHDLSFPGKFSGESINSRTNLDELVPCNYGHMLVRCIHYIVQLHLNHPNLPIILQKVDFKSAYRRIHLNANTATQCMTQIQLPTGKQLVLLPLRLTFGGSACPAEWCIVSEMVTDLINKILDHNPWRNPDTLCPSLKESLPVTTILPEETAFRSARELMVDINLSDAETGRADVLYVDDICTIGVLRDETTEKKLQLAALLALETVATSVISNPNPTAVTRDNIISMDKLHAEAGISEVKTLIGWELDTR